MTAINVSTFFLRPANKQDTPKTTTQPKNKAGYKRASTTPIRNAKSPTVISVDLLNLNLCFTI